ncbi:MAG: DUF3798 domain-containing protein [Candidatus Eiseniibacteriota bacterium]
MRSLAAVLHCLAAALLIAGCAPREAVPPPSSDQPFRIGIMTGTVSQNEEEFRAGQQVSAKYGDRVVHVSYPDNFMTEQETVIAQLTGLASDPRVKVIVVGQAVPGSVAAARKIREQRPEILIAFIEPHEDPAVVNVACDLAIQPDQLERGRTIVAEAAAMGAKHLVHYSFPRHMSQQLLADRRDRMKQACTEMGLDFLFVTAPDPMAEGGLPATQQFVLEDQPRQVKKLGTDTAFFSTNCGMQEPLIRSVLTNGGYVPEQCCPSPTHGYPTALGIGIPPEKAGDIAYINTENRRVIAEHGMQGHFGTWVAPESMVALRAAANLLVDAVDGKIDYKDPAVVQKYIQDEAGAPVRIRKYDETAGNQYLILLDHLVY